MDATLAELKRYNIVKAVAGGPREHVSRWLAADPGRIIGGTMLGVQFEPARYECAPRGFSRWATRRHW